MTATPYAAYNTWARNAPIEKPRISMVIPTYNEEIRILPTVGAIALHLSQRGEPWELIVADDGSADGTVALLEKLDWANLRVRVAERNGGEGSAVRRGMLAARGDYILFAEADQSTPIKQFDPLLAQVVLNGYHVAIGSRAAVGTVVSNKSLVRRETSRGPHTAVRVGFGLSTADTQCGLQLFTTAAAHRLFDLRVINSLPLDLEVLHLAERLGAYRRGSDRRDRRARIDGGRGQGEHPVRRRVGHHQSARPARWVHRHPLHRTRQPAGPRSVLTHITIDPRGAR